MYLNDFLILEKVICTAAGKNLIHIIFSKNDQNERTWKNHFDSEVSQITA